MSYELKTLDGTHWDESGDGEALTVWFDRGGERTYTLPGVHYKPGYECKWIEDEWTVTLWLTTFIPHPEGGIRQVSVMERLAKNLLEIPTAEGAEGPVEYFINAVTRKIEEFQREMWLRIEWPEAPNVEQG
jgi:hypothetical protein